MDVEAEIKNVATQLTIIAQLQPVLPPTEIEPFGVTNENFRLADEL